MHYQKKTPIIKLNHKITKKNSPNKTIFLEVVPELIKSLSLYLLKIMANASLFLLKIFQHKNSKMPQ